MKVTPDVHKAVLDRAKAEGTSADEAIRDLLGASAASVRIPLAGIQRKRWEDAARDAGVPLGQFITMRVEAALQWGVDPGLISQLRDLFTDIRRVVPRH